MIAAIVIGVYTNLAGNVIAGAPVALAPREVTISNQTEVAAYPLSIFPTNEQRRIAADFGEPKIPADIRRAVAGAEKAIRREQKRAEKGLCTREAADAFIEKTRSGLKKYLDRAESEGRLLPAERKALGF